MKYINLDFIKFNKVSFIGSSYGVIWDGKYKDKTGNFKEGLFDQIITFYNPIDRFFSTFFKNLFKNSF
jgi:hypothetical protein